MSKSATIPEATSAEARQLMLRAHGGSYACWVRIQPVKSNSRALGAASLRRDFHPGVLGRIVTEVGGPAYILPSTRGSQPCLYIRARFGTDFKELCRRLYQLSSAMGYETVVLDATENAYSVISRGITR